MIRAQQMIQNSRDGDGRPRSFAATTAATWDIRHGERAIAVAMIYSEPERGRGKRIPVEKRGGNRLF
jgi:hypothetical protein